MARYTDQPVGFDEAEDFDSFFGPNGMGDDLQPHYGGHSRNASANSVLSSGYTYEDPSYRHYVDEPPPYQPMYFDPSHIGNYDQVPTTTTTPDTKLSAITTFSDKSASKSSRSSRSARSSKSEKSTKKVVVKVEEAVTPPKEQVKKRPKKGKKQEAEVRAEAETELDEEEEGDDKRGKFLERNRIAASKCRQKKKEWMNGLEEKSTGLEQRHEKLQMEYTGLLGEVNRMKDQLMCHAACNDPKIDGWLENEARRFVQKSRHGHAYESYETPNASGSAYPEPQPSLLPPMSQFSRVTSPRGRGSFDMNYDHMPDVMFEENDK